MLTDVVIVPVEVIVPPLINPAVAIEVTVPFPLLLKVVQSAALKAPLFKADAVGTFKVITGVVVLLATVDERSVPVVPKVKAATDVTVPPEEGLLLVIVKLGYVPVTPIPVPAVSTTVWSGKVFVTVGTVVVPPIEIPVPAPNDVTLLLKVVKSELLNLPVLVALATGRLKVCVDVADDILKSVPLVPMAKVCTCAVKPFKAVMPVENVVVT